MSKKKIFFFLLKKILEIFGKKLSKIRLFLINSESWQTTYLGAENEKNQNLKIPAYTLFRGRKWKKWKLYKFFFSKKKKFQKKRLVNCPFLKIKIFIFACNRASVPGVPSPTVSTSYDIECKNILKQYCSPKGYKFRTKWST